MGVLRSNVFVGGSWYGPAYGNADQVPADLVEGMAAGVWEDDGGALEPAAPAAPEMGSLAEAKTAAQVKAWVGSDPDRAREALEAENAREGGPRSTLVSDLNKVAK